MIYLDWNKYKQKPHQWGPLSAVRSAVFRNAARMGIDPKTILSALPLWSGAGHELPSYGLAGSAAIGDAVWSNSGISTAAGNGLTATTTLTSTSKYSFYGVLTLVQNRKQGILQRAAGVSDGVIYGQFDSGGVIRAYVSSSSVSQRSSFIPTVGQPFAFCLVFDGTKTNADRIKMFFNGELDPSTASGIHQTTILATKGTEIGYASQYSGYSWLRTDGDFGVFCDFDGAISDAAAISLTTTPYALLAPNPGKLIFDLAAGGGTTYQVTCADGITAADTPTKRAIFSAACADGMSAADSDGGAATLTATLAETLNLSDAAAKALVMALSVSDGFTAADTASKTAAYRATAADGATFSDSTLADILGSLQAECSDGVVLSDSLSVIAQLLATAPDGVTVSDAALWGGILSALVADGITLSDAANKALRLFATSADGVTVSDAGTPVMTFSAGCADGVEFAETLAAIMRFAAACSDGFEVSDSASVPSGTMAAGKVTVSFNLKQAKIVFSVSKPGISFTLN